MVMAMRAMAVAGAQMVMAMSAAARLPDQVVEPEDDQRAAGDPGEDVAGPLARLDPQPDDQGAENGREENMSRAAQRHHHERLRLAPALPATGQHEGQPVGRNGGMSKRDDKPSRHDG